MIRNLYINITIICKDYATGQIKVDKFIRSLLPAAVPAHRQHGATPDAV